MNQISHGHLRSHCARMIMKFVIAGLLLAAGIASVILSLKEVGYTWDEAYYYEPARFTIAWFKTLTATGWHQQTVDQFWALRSEHPSLQRLLSAVSLMIFERPGWPLDAMRYPSALCFGLTLALIFLICYRRLGIGAALGAALVYATLPRVWGHAHLAAIETPLNLTMLLATYGFIRGTRSYWWGMIAGILFGIALATKINAFFLPIPFILWSLLFGWRRKKRLCVTFLSMLILGSLTLVLLWPWLWNDTLIKLAAYIRFHLQHQLTSLYFLGKTWGYGNSVAPWFYPSVIFAVSTPLLSLILMILGGWYTLTHPKINSLASISLLCVFVILTVASLPSTPKYDGVRLFLPVFPYLAILSGVGIYAIAQTFHQKLRKRKGRLFLTRCATVGIMIAVVLVGIFNLSRWYPYTLSYFNILIGDLSKAQMKGFEITYWGEALGPEMLEALNALPDGTSVQPLALHDLCLFHLQSWGALKPTLKIGGNPPFDTHLLLMRRGFFMRPERALAESRRFPVIYEVKKDGIALIALYRTGSIFEDYWPTLPRR